MLLDKVYIDMVGFSGHPLTYLSEIVSDMRRHDRRAFVRDELELVASPQHVLRVES